MANFDIKIKKKIGGVVEQTEFLEVFGLNYPAVKSYGGPIKMKKAQIIHSDPIKAAEHINKIAANPKEWWFNKKTVEAKKKFYNLPGSN